MNSKQQSDIGLASAIRYYTRMGYTVCIPLTDSQSFDLIAVDTVTGKSIKRIQVKTTSYKEDSGNYNVSLTIKGGNQSFSTIKKFDSTLVDEVYILTNDDEEYCIPSIDINTQSITLGKKYQKYKATLARVDGKTSLLK